MPQTDDDLEQEQAAGGLRESVIALSALVTTGHAAAKFWLGAYDRVVLVVPTALRKSWGAVRRGLEANWDELVALRATQEQIGAIVANILELGRAARARGAKGADVLVALASGITLVGVVVHAVGRRVRELEQDELATPVADAAVEVRTEGPPR